MERSGSPSDFLASSTSKKVHIRRFDREELLGFVNFATYLTEKGLELLSPTGNVSLIHFEEIKMVEFVRNFEPSSSGEKKVFLTRPKMEGLWIRAAFRDGDMLEGVLPNNLLQVERLGLTLTPPDFTANRQRVFLPRSAVTEVLVLGVVGSPLKRMTARKPHPPGQLPMFE